MYNVFALPLFPIPAIFLLWQPLLCRNGESKGFGFVTMETDEDADEAVDKLDQTTWNGRVVLVEKAKSDKR